MRVFRLLLLLLLFFPVRRYLLRLFEYPLQLRYRRHFRPLQCILPRITPYRRIIQRILDATSNEQPQHILRTPCLRPRVYRRARFVRRNRSRVRRMPLLAHNADLTGIAFDVPGTGINRTTADCWRHHLFCSLLHRNDNVSRGTVQCQPELPPLHQRFFHRLLRLQIRVRLRQWLPGIRLYDHKHGLRPQYGVRQDLLFLLLRSHATRQHHDTREQCQYSYSHMSSSVRARSRFHFSHSLSILYISPACSRHFEAQILLTGIDAIQSQLVSPRLGSFRVIALNLTLVRASWIREAHAVLCPPLLISRERVDLLQTKHLRAEERYAPVLLRPLYNYLYVVDSVHPTILRNR